MKSKLLHTPVGVRDIYGEECKEKRELEHRIHHVFHSYGYQDIQTPTFEFFDIFSKERGSVASKNLYKFFDREGNTLVLRPDMTPSIARSAAKYYMDEAMPIRLCYHGNAFMNNSEYQGKLKEFTQMGCEFIGENSSDCDAEVIATVIESLTASGLTEYQIEIGQVDFFRSIVQDAGLPEEFVEELRELLENKKYFAMDDVLSRCNLTPEQRQVFEKLPELFGSVEILTEAKKLTTNRAALQSIERLEKIYDLLKVYGYEKYVSFDLTMLSMYQYYTGVVFKGYTYGTGDAIVTGGRYDHLLGQFGKDSAAIGFAVNIDGLLVALRRQHIPVNVEEQRKLVVYPTALKEQAILKSRLLREQGYEVALLRQHQHDTLEACEAYAKRMGFDDVVIIS